MNDQRPQISDLSKPAAPDLREGLLECLSNIEPSDSSKPFAISNALLNPINPGIVFTDGFNSGSIDLPLSDRDAEVIRAVGTPLPVLTNVKIGDVNSEAGTTPPEPELNIWDVPASMFELRNPAWNGFLKGVVKDVAKGLGVDAMGNAVSARLCKMSMFEEGAMVEPGRE